MQVLSAIAALYHISISRVDKFPPFSQALFAPMMEHLLGWKETRNSYLYSAIGVEVMITVNKYCGL